MIVNEIIDYHANHLFSAFQEQVDTKIEDLLSTGFLPNRKSIHLDLSAAVVKAIEDTIRDRRVDSAIRRTTLSMLESGLFVRYIYLEPS